MRKKRLYFLGLILTAGAVFFVVYSKKENNIQPNNNNQANNNQANNAVVTFSTQEECENVTQKQCSYGMCDYHCGNDYWEGWRATDKDLERAVNAVEKNVAEDEGTEEGKAIALPKKILVSVPFTAQAPYAKWDERHEEACEEASLLMVKYYLDGKKLNKEIAEREIQALIDFQIKNYGDYKDSNASGVVKLADDYYGIKKLKVVYDFKKEDLKKELAKGQPIIVPAAGRLLGNPNFTAPGPLYHALVLVGYESDTIITNDPGTRKGEGYRYNIDILYGAIHDFPGKKEDIEKGRKAMIIVE